MEGEVVKVFEVDEDGFARGQNSAGRTGWMPSNFLTEVPEPDDATSNNSTNGSDITDRVQTLLAQQEAVDAVAQEAEAVAAVNVNNVRYYQVRTCQRGAMDAARP